MDFNIDAIIFIAFLTVTVVAGLLSSRGIKSIQEYAIGNRNFSTATIAATLIATWAGGQAFLTIVTESYNHGLHFMWATILGDFVCYLLIGLFFAPRMTLFLGKLSIADAMGSLYGDKVRVITAIAACIGAAGMIAVQLKMVGTLFEYALNIPSSYGILLAGIIISLYSSLGGIKSVTFTDIIQFFTFIVIIPTTSYILLSSINNIDIITYTLQNNSNFDYKEVFNFSNPSALYHLFIFLFFIVPSFNPAIFQRVAMAKNSNQIKQSFIIASVTCLIFAVTVSWIGILTLSINPNLSSSEIVKYIIFDYSNVGLRGAILAGIMAMVFSTVDSYINSTAVILVHDFCKPLKLKFAKNELLSARIVSLLIGLIAVVLSLRGDSLLELIIFTNSFYMPIVTIPFIVSILGFRTTEKSVLFGMISGFTIVLLWDYVLQISSVNSVPIGMLANFITLVCSHYFLKQQGGFYGINYYKNNGGSRNVTKINQKEFSQAISKFNLIRILKQNSPKNEGVISLMGFFVMISSFGSFHSLGIEYKKEYAYLLNILYPISLFGASLLISYPLWLQNWKVSNFIAVIWNIIVFFVLICFACLLVLISNFSDIQLMVFLVNIIVLSSLMKWRWSLTNIMVGVILTQLCFEQYIVSELFNNALLLSEFKIIYMLLLLSSTLIIFLKPKQEYLEATEAKVETLDHELTDLNGQVTTLNTQVGDLNDKVSHYSQRVTDHEQEIERLGATAQKILNNVNHELRLPIGNVVNFSDMLHETLQKSDNKLLQEMSEEVFKNSTRVSTMILNMLDLATLEVKKVDLQKKTINFGELVEDRVKRCRKIYLQNKKITFELLIEPEVMIAVDPNYIRQMVDNIVINSLTYSTEGLIKVFVYKVSRRVELIIEDQGMGIPQKDIYDIFDPFKMGSNTDSKAEGRGIGLSLCKSVVEAHGGSITAASDGKKGAKFTVILPF